MVAGRMAAQQSGRWRSASSDDAGRATLLRVRLKSRLWPPAILDWDGVPAP
uniref:Uncharacterized protein n=1 Tax=Arundo donax TaxID=35708 RepID=A0A0A9GKD0_ARUDO